MPQSPETSTLLLKLTTAPAGLVAVTTMSAGQPRAQVAGAPPAPRTSTEATAELLAGRGSFVSLPMSAVVEITWLAAPALTVKFSVIVATAPLAQVATEQSTMPELSAQEKADEVLAVVKVKSVGTAMVTCTLSAVSGPGLLSHRKKLVFAPGETGSDSVLKL